MIKDQETAQERIVNTMQFVTNVITHPIGHGLSCMLPYMKKGLEENLSYSNVVERHFGENSCTYLSRKNPPKDKEWTFLSARDKDAVYCGVTINEQDSENKIIVIFGRNDYDYTATMDSLRGNYDSSAPVHYSGKDVANILSDIYLFLFFNTRPDEK